MYGRVVLGDLCNRANRSTFTRHLLSHFHYHCLVCSIEMNSSEEPPAAVIPVEQASDTAKEIQMQNPASGDVNKPTNQNTVVTKPEIMAEPAPCFMKLRIGFAATGVFVGLSILICFQADPTLRNLHIALWGLASGKLIYIYNTTCCTLHTVNQYVCTAYCKA